MCQLTQYSTSVHMLTLTGARTKFARTHDGMGKREKGSWRDIWGWWVGRGQGIPFAPGSIDKPGSQLVRGEAAPPAPRSPKPLPSARSRPGLLNLVWSELEC